MLHTLKHLSPSCGSICVSEIGMQEEVSHNTLLLNCCDARSWDYTKLPLLAA